MSLDLEKSTSLMLDFTKIDGGIIPVVTQDFETLEVLILSYVNEEALRLTRESGYAVYYSRSRKSLWHKGETSGNKLEIVEIRINCEQNSLLFLVKKTNDGACHAKKENGEYYSGCYFRKVNADDSLSII